MQKEDEVLTCENSGRTAGDPIVAPAPGTVVSPTEVEDAPVAVRAPQNDTPAGEPRDSFGVVEPPKG